MVGLTCGFAMVPDQHRYAAGWLTATRREGHALRAPTAACIQPPGLLFAVRAGVATGEWEIYLVDEARDWIDSLDPAAHARVVQVLDLLAENRSGARSDAGRHDPRLDDRQPQGPTGPEPYASCSRSAPGAPGSRLVTGDKAGRWNQWYFGPGGTSSFTSASRNAVRQSNGRRCARTSISVPSHTDRRIAS